MKILYGIQGTGNGHITRAKEIIPFLEQYGQLDLFVSGFQSDIRLPYEVKHKSKGVSFVFGKNGGIDFLRTLQRNSLQRINNEIQEFPVEDYDVVVNDFEPISAWAAYRRNVLCIGLSHQIAILSPKTPKPETSDIVGKWILENFAPPDVSYGFHFKSYDNNIFTPVIRKEIRESKSLAGDHYTIYLPSYSDEKIIKVLGNLNERSLKWHVFSKHTKRNYKVNNVSVFSLDAEFFAKSMISSRGVICGAGFETPAEALALNKKLLVVPMKNQYEQMCNGIALKELGIAVIKKFGKSSIEYVREWIDSSRPFDIYFPDITQEIVDRVITKAENILIGEKEFLAQV